MWFIGVEVEQETSAPPPKKNPGSAPALSIGPVPGIKPTTSHSAVKHYALPTVRILLQLTSRIFNIVSCTCYYLASP